MPYIGNNIRSADDYRLVDDISGSFNGSTTSFALLVAGSTPVPFPKTPQQVLISVNGVIQEPDPTGASGFTLTGNNIVFSSAPTGGHSFFGIIYATADYLNAGGTFPDGSVGAPSITFTNDDDTGLFRKGSGDIGFISNATEIATIDNNGINISAGNLTIPGDIIHAGDTNTKIRFSNTDQIKLETAGAQRLKLDATEVVFNDDGASVDFRIEGDTDANLFKIDASADKVGIGESAPDSKLEVKSVDSTYALKLTCTENVSGSYNGLSIAGADENAGSYPLVIVSNTTDTHETGGHPILCCTQRKVGIGTLSPDQTLHVHKGSAGSVASFSDSVLTLENNDRAVLQFLTPSNANAQIRFGDPADNGAGFIQYNHTDNAIQFGTNGPEKMRIDASGNVGIGTSSPSRTLHVNSGSTNEVARFESTDTEVTVEFKDLTGTATLKCRNDYRFHNDSGELVRLDSDGDLLVGLTTALSTQAGSIQAAGPIISKSFINAHTSNAAVLQYISNKAVLRAYGATSGSGILQFNVGGGGDATDFEAMRIDSSGNMSVGGTSPSTQSAKFQTRGTSQNATRINMHHEGNSSASISANGGLVFASDTSNGTTEHMVIDTSGKVGIGESSPTKTLVVSENDSECVQIIKSSDTGFAGLFLGGQSDEIKGGILFDNSTDKLTLRTHNNSIAMTLDSSENVGIGETSPSHRLHISSANENETIAYFDTPLGGRGLKINTFASGNAASAGVEFEAPAGANKSAFVFKGATEFMRISSGGELIIGDTSQINSGFLNLKFSGTTHNGIVLKTTRTQTGTNFIRFLNSDGDLAGEIEHNGTTTVVYTTSSDYRLKENAVAISDGITRLKTLKPYRFNFKTEPDRTVDGFFAHEVTAVPEAVTGTKDEVDSDNKPVYQGIDQSKLVPLLVAALQEAIGRIEALEAA